MGKILLALQFWKKDKADALDLARLITDLQPAFCDQADFLLMARHDETNDPDTIAYVSRKFNVYHSVARRRGHSWPFGTTQLWLSTLDWLYAKRLANKVPEYEAIATFEPDSCPLRPDWISLLRDGWHAANTSVYGHLLNDPVHINGNALYTCDLDFLLWVTRKHRGVPPNAGWDVFLAPEFEKRGWKNSPEIRSWWNCKQFTPEQGEQLLKEGVVFLHGVKTDQVRKFVRGKYNL